MSSPSFEPLFAALAFRGWFPVWLALLMGFAALVATVLLYWREAGKVPAWRRAVLAGIRGLALLSILFLLMRPTLLTERRGERPRPIAVLVDDSQSMATRDARPTFADKWRVGVAFDRIDPAKKLPEMPSSGDLPEESADRPTRTDIAKAALENPRLNLLDQLGERGPLQPATFGLTRSSKDPRDKAWVGKLNSQQQRTAMADSIFDILRKDENELPAAVVLVTDGRDNASTRGLDELARECARLQVPLHVYGVGSSTLGQVQIRDAVTPDSLFVDDTVSVPVRYRVKGFKEGKVEILVRLNGNEVARKIVDVKEGDDLRELLSFVPQQKDAAEGKQILTTSVRVLSGPEALSDELTRTVKVLDRKVKVLVVDWVPRWDFKFLQRALLRDRRVEASFLLLDGDRKAMDAGKPFIPKFPGTRAELFGYDLLVLGDVPATFLSLEQQTFVRDFVAEGGGFIHIAGRNHGPTTFVGTPLADVLPVELQSVQFAIDTANRPLPFRPNLTSTGIRSRLLSLDDDPVESLRIWRTLPEIYWAYPVTKLKPASEVYLTHPTLKTADNKPMPLLASHYYGKGFSLYVGFDETWRWRFNEADKYFGRFWSQAIYVTGVPSTLGTKLTQLSLDTPDPLLGKTGQIYARIYSPDLKPLTADRLEARLERLDVGPDDKDRSRPIELKALPGQAGEYVATVPFNRIGRFALKVDNGSDPASLEYRVTLPPDHELAPGGLADDELRKLAEASGGKFYREEDLHELAKNVKPKSTPYTSKEEILLWNVWGLLWVVFLLSAEWFLRKSNSLS